MSRAVISAAAICRENSAKYAYWWIITAADYPCDVPSASDNLKPMGAYAALSLVPAVRAGETLSGGSSRTRREFLDFHIDGQSLRDALHNRADTPITTDLVSVLVTNWPGGFPAEEAEMLLGQRPAPFPGGRVALYVCPECGGYGCGAVTATLGLDNAEFVWRDLGWQTDYDPEIDFELYRGLGPFRFKAQAYEDALRDLLPRRKQPQRDS